MLRRLVLAGLLMTGLGLAQQGAGTEVKMHHATGSFEVKIKPEGLSEVAAETKIRRMSIDKVFHGALEGTSKGEMLSAMSEVKGSAGYVAMERVTGTLEGKKGSFYLQHMATMDRGVPSLKITVVPDSGTEELVGLTGTMGIVIAEGKHSYDFDYGFVGK